MALTPFLEGAICETIDFSRSVIVCMILRDTRGKGRNGRERPECENAERTAEAL